MLCAIGPTLMSQVADFFKKLFDTSDWPARWFCGNWTEFHGWLYIISDLLIWSAYFAIPILIIRYISTKKTTVRFNRLYFLFATFILACGSTHLLDAITFWHPVYRLNAITRAFTGIVSWITVFQMMKFLPVAFALKTPAELEIEVDQRKRAEAMLRIKNDQLNEVQSISRIGYWEWQIKTNRVSWSPGLYNIYEIPYQVEGLTYEEFLSFLHPDDSEYVKELISHAFEEKMFPEYYHRIITAKGKSKILFARGEVQTDKEGTVIGMLGTTQDVTDIKKAEEQLIEKTETLQRINEELQKFAYVTSHDLKEPLRKIRTFNSRLIGEYSDTLDEKAMMFLKRIESSAVRMQSLIDDILEFSNISNHFEFQPTDLNEVVKQVLIDMELPIQEKNVKIVVGKLPVIDAHASQMYQLFQNLISNSIKFSRKDAEPEISITYEMKTPIRQSQKQSMTNDKQRNVFGGGAICIIKVKDNGIGFDEKYVSKIFDVFQRLHTKHQYDGTGIGLAICKKIIENHQGTITAESRINQGSTFIIQLPVQPHRRSITLKEDNLA